MERTAAGARWWMYERPVALSPGASGGAPPGAVAVADEPGGGLPDRGPATPVRPPAYTPTGVSFGVLAAACVLAVVVGTRGFGLDDLGVVLFPLAGVLAAVAFGRRARRHRPDEPWLPRLILIATVVKIGAALGRYYSFAELYQGVGDAYVYDREARELLAFWAGERDTSPMEGLALTGSNVLRWVTGYVYYLFGQNLMAAFVLFGLIAMVGSYFWYRALSDSVPYVDRRLFLIFMLFVPSIVFWPASLGKEALMQVGLGAMAWATSLALTGRMTRAIPLAVLGGGLLYMIRPHLLALVALAAAVPYFVGHVRRDGTRSVTARPAGMVVVALLAVFSVTAGVRFLGIENLSIDSVEEQLDAQTAATSYGGSTYDHGGNSLTNPLFIPMGFVTVLFRPFLWESSSLLQLAAAVEASLLLGLAVHRRRAILLALRRCRREPFLLYCTMLLFFYAIAFSSLANFGLLTRQRSLVLPALYALIAVAPGTFRRQRGQAAGDPISQYSSGS